MYKNKILSLLLMCCLLLSACSNSSINNESKDDEKNLNYSDDSLWAYNATDSTKAADLFIIAPTTYKGDSENINMPLDNEEEKSKFIGALNMEKGIYENTLNMYSPYYRQGSLSAIDENKIDEAYSFAYSDVSQAFEYYMNNKNNNRPFVLAGFSQGSYMCIELMKNYPEYLTNMIACYEIGWSLTEADVKNYPQLIPAEGETDTGVIICFNSEAENIESSFIIPRGTKSYCINPLNWKTDNTHADKTLNAGSCFTDYSGNIKKEISNLTGAYIDKTRGSLKVTDISDDSYPAGLKFMKSGEYHIYDYQFFYRNLQQNVEKRIEQYINKR